jgi:uncharacterized protein (DUF433 family)
MVHSDVSDEQLIAEHFELNVRRRGIEEAAVSPSAVSVWALIGYLPVVDHDPVRLAEAYDITLDEVLAALAYYRRHPEVIDARIQANCPDDD